MSDKTDTLVLYHDDADGFASAIVAYHHYPFPIEIRPVQYGQEPPDVKGQHVRILDFSYSREVLLKMNKQAESLLVIDHHKTAASDLADLPFCIFDMTKAGCVLTWEYYFPYEYVPDLLLYVQDRDLWKWELHMSREVNAGIRSYAFDIPLWIGWLQDGDFKAMLANEGAAILRDQKQYVESKIAKEPEWVEIGGYHVPTINNTHLVSEVTQALCEKHNAPFAASYFDTPEKRVFSMRSVSDDVDVSKIAKQYGGGGHPRAAGFEVGLEGKWTSLHGAKNANHRH